MEVRVDQIETTPTHLLLGCVVVGPKKSWVRFCKVKILLEAIPTEDLWAILQRDQKAKPERELSDELF